jgi:hypothetical protein
MSKEIVELFEYILDQIEPRWKTNEAVVETLEKIKGSQSKRFAPPSLQEVTEELKSQRVRNYQQQADKFWNFYEAKNWMIGKNKMKSWKAAIKTWNFDKDNLLV